MNAPLMYPIDLDYTCPFSAKMFHTFYRLRSTLTQKYPNLTTIFRPQVQPWHPSSTLTHEAALAVGMLAPGAFWTYSRLLFEDQKEYFDANVVNETRNQTYRRLAQLAGQLESEVSKEADRDVEVPKGIEEKVYQMLEISDKPDKDGGLNVGNKVTDALKVQIKAARLVGVHVSPTVIFDGVVRGEVSSSWDEGEWEKWLGENAQ